MDYLSPKIYNNFSRVLVLMNFHSNCKPLQISLVHDTLYCKQFIHIYKLWFEIKKTLNKTFIQGYTVSVKHSKTDLIVTSVMAKNWPGRHGSKAVNIWRSSINWLKIVLLVDLTMNAVIYCGSHVHNISELSLLE